MTILKKFNVIENHYYDDKQVEFGREWVSVLRLDLIFISIEIKYPTWKKWSKTRFKNNVGGKKSE